MKEENNIDDLIGKVLSGEASEPENLTLNAWRQEAASNEEYFRNLEKIFEISGSLKTKMEFDQDAAWEQVRKRIHEKGTGEQPLNPVTTNFTSFIFRAAAMVLFATGLSYSAYKLFTPESLIIQQTITSVDVTQEFSLPDSSLITLNKNSELEFVFDDDKRETNLTGEAYFDLADDNRPFVLYAGTLTITDIGTSFNVKADSSSDSVIVIVSSGEVLIRSRGNKEVTLKEGDQAIYLKKRDSFIQSALSDTNALAYKTKIFVFDNTKLSVIVEKLNEIYGSRILLSDNISECKLTVTFKNETIENIVEVISETLNFEIVKSDDEILLKGDRCD